MRERKDGGNVMVGREPRVREKLKNRSKSLNHYLLVETNAEGKNEREETDWV